MIRLEWAKRFPNFAPEEVLSPDGLSALERGIIVINLTAMEFLEQFRNYVGYPLVINTKEHAHRGYRSFAENLHVGGERFSFHMQGVAFDITCPELNLFELRERAIKFGWHAIGYYPKRGFIHCDLRPMLDENQTLWEIN